MPQGCLDPKAFGALQAELMALFVLYDGPKVSYTVGPASGWIVGLPLDQAEAVRARIFELLHAAVIAGQRQ